MTRPPWWPILRDAALVAAVVFAAQALAHWLLPDSVGPGRVVRMQTGLRLGLVTTAALAAMLAVGLHRERHPALHLLGIGAIQACAVLLWILLAPLPRSPAHGGVGDTRVFLAIAAVGLAVAAAGLVSLLRWWRRT